MKTYALTSVLLCFLSISIYAQDQKLTPEAEKLFDGLTSKLNTTERNTIAKLIDFSVNERDQRFYKTVQTEDDNLPYRLRVYVFDLTNDGHDEIGIVYNPVGQTELKDTASILFVKDEHGQYKLNLKAPGEFYFLNVNDLVFPDIYIRNTTIGLPTYRWNGTHYIKHTNLNPKRLKRFVVSSMRQVSNAYAQILVRE